MTNALFRTAGLAGLFLFTTAAMTGGGTASSGTKIGALRQVEKGQWELRSREAPRSEPVRRICIDDPSQLLQVRHGDMPCSRFVIADSDNRAVVSYRCKGSGNGRTDLRVETPRLVQIESQGVAEGEPFALSIEARRIGDCR
ncbi:MAG: DUF3617 domain-containing protein [Sphingobium sp.]